MRNRMWMGALLMAAALDPSLLPGAEGTRTSDGRPDLSGVYDIATLTPLLRPTSLGDRLSLSDAEAKALAQTTAATLAKRNAASNPNRTAPPAGGDGSEGPAGNVGGYN